MKTFFINSTLTEARRTDIGTFRNILQFLEDGLESPVSGWDYAVRLEGGVKHLAELTECERAELREGIVKEMTFHVRTPSTYQNGSDIDVGRRYGTDDSDFLSDIERHLELEGMRGAIQKIHSQGIQLTSYGWRWVAGAQPQPYHLEWVGLIAYFTELGEDELPDLSKTPLISKLVALLRDELDRVEPVWE